jgi:hypothetical protein
MWFIPPFLRTKTTGFIHPRSTSAAGLRWERYCARSALRQVTIVRCAIIRRPGRCQKPPLPTTVSMSLTNCSERTTWVRLGGILANFARVPATDSNRIGAGIAEHRSAAEKPRHFGLYQLNLLLWCFSSSQFLLHERDSLRLVDTPFFARLDEKVLC